MATERQNEDVDIHTTAGKIADLERRLDEAVHAGSARAGGEAARQGQDDRPGADRRCFSTRARSSSSTSWPGTGPRVRHGEQPPVRRRRRDRLRHGGRPAVAVFEPGLHRLRRLPRRGLRREDRQGHGLRAEDRLPDGRDQRLRRCADPGGRGLARAVRRDLQAERARFGCDPADLADHRPVRGRRGLLPRDHRLRGDGRPDLAHVHHRPGRDQDGDRRGGDVRGTRRRPHAQHQVAAWRTTWRPTRRTRSSTSGRCCRTCRRTTSPTPRVYPADADLASAGRRSWTR